MINNIYANKYTDYSWDFRKENTKGNTHCFHSYPAMMIPQIANRLLENYATHANLLFDPYCGTGTSLVEANLRNINAVGTDLNPLARLIAKVKTTIIDLNRLSESISNFLTLINNRSFNITNIERPDFNNINYWFDERVLNKLMIIKSFIKTIENVEIRNFYNVAFSETIRESSWTRNGEFKLYRMNEKQISKFEPKVFELMINKLHRNYNGLKEYILNLKGNAKSIIYDFNSVDYLPENLINNVDIVLTSPPYGDSRTTVAYGQFSRLANQWLDISEASKIDNMLMGGSKSKEFNKFEFSILNDVIKEIAQIDNKRALEINSFYYDYYSSIKNVAKTIKSKGYACYIVGNRTVKGITLPTDEITINFFEMNGFKHIETIIRNIPNKRMPAKNCPTNIKGKKSTTMLNEYIVVLQKD